MSVRTSALRCFAAGTLLVSASGALADENYYSIRPDARLCISPVCGGFFAAELNAPFTVCADGTVLGECYVAEVNSDVPGMADLAAALPSAIVKGQILPKIFDPFGNLGQLTITEVWEVPP